MPRLNNTALTVEDILHDPQLLISDAENYHQDAAADFGAEDAYAALLGEDMPLREFAELDRTVSPAPPCPGRIRHQDMPRVEGSMLLDLGYGPSPPPPPRPRFYHQTPDHEGDPWGLGDPQRALANQVSTLDERTNRLVKAEGIGHIHWSHTHTHTE
jgi:hypothetical protein